MSYPRLGWSPSCGLPGYPGCPCSRLHMMCGCVREDGWQRARGSERMRLNRLKSKESR